MAYTAIVLALWASLEEFNDVYLNFLGFSRSIIGLIFALACAGQSLASSLAHRFKNRSWLMINASVIFSAVVLILATIIKHPLMAIGILSLGILLEFISVLKEGLIQKETKSYQRATVSSMSGLIMNLAPYQLIFGFFASRHNLQIGYGFFGMFVLSYFALNLMLRKIPATF